MSAERESVGAATGGAPARVPVAQARAQIAAVLQAWGMAADLVEPAVDALVYADVSGIDSHGINLLVTYDAQARKGKLNLRARPRVVRESPASALVDADAGIGHPAAVMAMRLAVEKARASTVAAVSVFNSHHFGAAGYYAAIAARAGMIGFVTCTTRMVSVVPTRAAEPVLGTNPLAFAAPAGRHPPFLLDMSTATVAVNKLRAYDHRRKALPEGWVVDGEGRPVRDAAMAVELVQREERGGVTPLGGTPDASSHKGYGLGMMVQLLAGALGGGSFSPIRNRTQAGADPDNIGQFFLAIDPRAFRPDGAFEADVDAAIDVLHGARPVDPASPVLVAGDPEEQARQDRVEKGIPVPAPLREKIRAVCERCGAPFLIG